MTLPPPESGSRPGGRILAGPGAGVLLTLLLLLSACGPEETSRANDASTGETAAPTSPEPGPQKLPDTPAGDLIRAAIEAHGGWKRWTATRTVEYRKTVLHFGPDGREESRTVERHRYALHPGPGMRMEYEDEAGRQILILNDGDEAWKFVDGELAASEPDRNQAWNSSFGSHYVSSMPFKLADPGVVPTYEGRDTLADGRIVDALRVAYEEGAGIAGGMHTWTYFFDADTHTLAANHLRHGPAPGDHSFTHYLDFRRVDGILVHERRTSHPSNPEMQQLGKTSEYRHEEVRFNVSLPDTLFVPLHRRDGA